jgi:hypothetical protein
MPKSPEPVILKISCQPSPLSQSSRGSRVESRKAAVLCFQQYSRFVRSFSGVDSRESIVERQPSFVFNNIPGLFLHFRESTVESREAAVLCFQQYSRFVRSSLKTLKAVILRSPPFSLTDDEGSLRLLETSSALSVSPLVFPTFSHGQPLFQHTNLAYDFRFVKRQGVPLLE